MAINDVLPLKAARRDAIANLKCFGASDTIDLTSMVTFTFTMWRHFIRLASAPCISSRLATFGWVRFLRATCGKQCRIHERWARTLILFYAVCGPKFTKFSDDVGSPLYFLTPFSGCLSHVLFRRYSPLSLEVVEKRSKCKRFWPLTHRVEPFGNISSALCTMVIL